MTLSNQCNSSALSAGKVSKPDTYCICLCHGLCPAPLAVRNSDQEGTFSPACPLDSKSEPSGSYSQGRILEVVFSRSYPDINKFDLQHIMASQVPSPGRNLLDLTLLRYDPPPPPPPVLACASAKQAYEPVFRRLPPYAAGGVILSFVHCRA